MIRDELNPEKSLTMARLHAGASVSYEIPVTNLATQAGGTEMAKPSINRAEAEELVLPLGAGGFIVRGSSNKNGSVITFVTGSLEIKNFKVNNREGGRVELNGKVFRDIAHLIDVGRTRTGEFLDFPICFFFIFTSNGAFHR